MVQGVADLAVLLRPDSYKAEPVCHLLPSPAIIALEDETSSGGQLPPICSSSASILLRLKHYISDLLDNRK